MGAHEYDQGIGLGEFHGFMPGARFKARLRASIRCLTGIIPAAALYF